MSKRKGISSERPWSLAWPDHVPRSLEYPDVPAWWIIERNLGKFSGNTAAIFVDHEDLSEIERLTYGELWQKANALAAALRKLGINKGDRVATILPNSPAIIISYYGIWMAGASVTPCNAMAKEKEIGYQLKDSGARMIIAADTHCDLAVSAARKCNIPLVIADVGTKGNAGPVPAGSQRFEDLVKTGESRPSDFIIDQSEDMAVLIYTGGTTGEPKGAILTHRNIVANTMQFAEWYDFKPGNEICVCTVPMSHSGGMSGVMNVPLYAAATLIIMKRFQPDSVAQAIEKYGATRFFGVPTMYVAIMNNEQARSRNMSTLRACRTNAAPLPVAVKQSFDALIGNETLVEGYGLTETSPLTHANPLHKPKAGSIGIALPDTDCKIIDLATGEDLRTGCEGELVIRGPQVMKSYWNKPEASEKAFIDGWFRTGDVARMDEEGYVYIIDRMKDMINTGGYKVWPREVEEVLYSHPKVNLAMVVGVADDYFGEIVKAYIVPKDNCREDITSEEIMAFCKKTMATYKTPRLIEFCDSLPISPQGKVLRRVMREREKAAQQTKAAGCEVCHESKESL
ncbi:MAG: long-chain-fatty-acid--CoA ligase [Candidatus Methylomirabilia bacterium]